MNGQKTDNTTEEEVSACAADRRDPAAAGHLLARPTPRAGRSKKVPREELQAIAARVEALGIPCSVA